MKTKNIKHIFAAGLIGCGLGAAFTSCSDDFLQEKKNYGNFDQTTVYSSFDGANERVATLYYWLLPITKNGSGGDGKGTNSPNDWTSIGYADKWAKSTEEYGGFSIYVNPSAELEYNYPTDFPHDFFFVANDNYSPYGHIRKCNDIIEGVSNGSGMSEEQKNQLLGQAYFFRAYMYAHLVKIYGGVPLIDHVQDPVLGSGGSGTHLAIPRSTAKECIDFICKDLDQAAALLPVRWAAESTDFGRVTSGLAMALKGQVLLMYASPLFNRADDASRWTAAYEANKKAIELLTQGSFGLTYKSDGGANNAANWARTWTDYTGSDGTVSEAVFVTLHNTKDNVSGQPNYGKYNYWEHSIRPKNVNGNGGLTPTAEMIDLFPMADGLKPGESTIAYDKKKFWLNRDPRFYRTFAFPGVQWQFSENGVDLTDASLVGIIKPGLTKGSDYELWSYTYNDNASDLASLTTTNGYWPDLLTSSADKGSSHSVYVRKKSDDLALHATPFYVYINSQANPKGFQKNAAPLLSMRYAEVLLNFAEAAAGANHIDEAEQALQQIRARVGYTAANNYGLNLGGTRATAIAAVLYERQIELAYEGKRFDDVRRWMLFDGGQGQAALKSSWALTGFGGNTCTWLGVDKLNGTKRHQLIMYCRQPCTADSIYDPAAQNRPAALTLNEDMSYIGGVYANASVQALGNWYDSYMERKDVSLDGNDDALTLNYLPKYYFLGLTENAMKNNVTLLQTIGWYGLKEAGNGTFDPLGE